MIFIAYLLCFSSLLCMQQGIIKNGNLVAQLHQAVETNNCFVLSELLKQPTMQFLIKEKQRALWDATKDGKTAIVQMLLQNEALPNFTSGETNSSTLHLACESGYLIIAQELILYGADVNALNSEEVTPLHLGASHGHVKICELLLAKGANPHLSTMSQCTPLLLATQDGLLSVVKCLLKQDDVKEKSQHYPNKFGERPIHIAACNGHAAILKMLLKNGALPNCIANCGFTPLMFAAQQGYYDCAVVLLSFKADSLQTINPRQAIHQAAQNGHSAIVSLFLENNFDINVQAENNVTPLFLAVSNKHWDIAQILLAKGANPNIVLKPNGVNVLHVAAGNGDINMVFLLLHHKVAVNSLTTENVTPLYYGAAHGHYDVVMCLLDNAADPTIATAIGLTPANIASRKGHTEIVELLEKTQHKKLA